MTTPDLSEAISHARADVTRAGRDSARCWAYWQASEEAAWASWLRDGLLSDRAIAILGLEVAQSLWRLGYRAECSYWREPVYTCKCCGKSFDRIEWLAREQRLGWPRMPAEDGAVISQIKCPCENGISRVLPVEEVARVA